MPYFSSQCVFERCIYCYWGFSVFTQKQVFWPSYCQISTDRDKIVGREDGCYREKFRNFVTWAQPDPKQHLFRLFRVPFDYLAHSVQETVLP